MIDPTPNTPTLLTFTKMMRAHTSLMDYLNAAVDFEPILQGSGFPILEVLYHKGDLPQCEIARLILRTSGNISLALDKLQKHGLIQRLAGADRRSHRVTLTPAGRALIAQAYPQMERAIVKAFSILTPQEQQTLGQLTKKLGLGLASEAGGV